MTLLEVNVSLSLIWLVPSSLENMKLSGPHTPTVLSLLYCILYVQYSV